MIGRAIFNQSPLPKNRLSALPLTAVLPDGWLKAQIDAQARALEAELFEDFPASFEDSDWLGGAKGDTVRTAELLVGLTSLAYLSDRPKLIDAVVRFVDWAIASQDERGNFGPKANPDFWARMRVLRALRAYFTATGDKRVLVLMDRYFRYELAVLEDAPLSGFAAARAGENMMLALWLYNLTAQKYLLTLCQKLRGQTIEWTNTLNTFPYFRALQKTRPLAELEKGLRKEPEITFANQPCFGREFHFTEAVNVAIGLKTPAVLHHVKSGFKETSAFKIGWQKLMKYHGLPSGMYAADRHLAGENPVQGVDTEATQILMETMEDMMCLSEDYNTEAADGLEKLAFNALPAAFAKDMTHLQRIGQVNQLVADRRPKGFYNAPSTQNLFVRTDEAFAAPGFAEFAASLWYATADDGLAAVSYAPCRVNFLAGGTRVRVRVETAYPFEPAVRIHVSVKDDAEFPLYLPIPTWARDAMLRLPDGEIMQVRAGESVCVRRKWAGEETVLVDLPMVPRITRWYHQAGAVEMGPLLFCLNPKEQWLLRGDDYAVTTKEEWAYALMANEPMKATLNPELAAPFKSGEPAATVRVRALRVPDWALDGLNAGNPPIQPETIAEPVILTLVPYGDTALHIAEFPVQM